MIRATIELVPYGQEAQARTLHRLTICNIGGTSERGKYVCQLNEGDSVWGHKSAYIYDWPRKERDAAALVHEALSRMGYGREV